ncbi:MAG: glycine C-acetyltransferase, partial [Solirubrobacterales bacterium]|nr:glycine C-acetyltransferase [Solirubrobacterales bacterium]
YLFSNSVAPPIVAASLAALELVESGGDARERLRANAALFRSFMTDAGFDLLLGEHPIIPVMVGDAARAGELAAALLEEGVLATAFSYPVVPRGAARIRTQMSAAHSEADVRRAVDAFVAARAKLA